MWACTLSVRHSALKKLRRCRPLRPQAHLHAVSLQISPVLEQPRCCLTTFCASQFDGLLNVQTLGAVLYKDVALARMSPRRRGDILAEVARGTILEQHPHSIISDPVAGVCCNGQARGLGRAEYDFLWDGRRVECKSAQLCWDQKCWRYTLHAIKLPLEGQRHEAPFDDLVVLLLTPEALYIYQHDGITGIARSGKGTFVKGHSIYFRGPAGEKNWRIVMEHILSHLDAPTNACRLLARLSLDDARIDAAVAKFATRDEMPHAYANVPLADFSPKARSQRIEALVRAVDSTLHPGARMFDAAQGSCENGSLRSKGNAKYDWLRDDVRIECKSSQLSWRPDQQRWFFAFQGIKLPSSHGFNSSYFDELYLALYSPIGIHIFRHNLEMGLTTTGTFMSIGGHNIQLWGPVREQRHAQALHVILRKLEDSGCTGLASVLWQKFDYAGIDGSAKPSMS